VAQEPVAQPLIRFPAAGCIVDHAADAERVGGRNRTAQHESRLLDLQRVHGLIATPHKAVDDQAPDAAPVDESVAK
jgi:hypothetical protein